MRASSKFIIGMACAMALGALPTPSFAQSGSSNTFTGPAQSIPDTGTTTSNISLPNFDVVPTKIVVSLNRFSHTFIGDLVVTVTHAGKSATLLSRQCGGTDATGGVVTFDDSQTSTTCPSSGSYTLKPATPLSVFNTVSAAGTWTLTISDNAGGDSGSTGGWSLKVFYNGANSYSWQEGGYGPWSNTCGSATRTRSVTCVGTDGQTYPEGACSAYQKPATSETSTQTSGCSYSWKTSSWTQVAACGPTTDRRTAWCQRSDGTTVEDAACAGTKPALTQTSATPNYDTCSYGWSYGSYGPWSTTCGDATRTRSATCVRSDGATVTDGYCSSATRSVTQNEHIVTSCTTRWDTGSWSTTPACGPTDESRRVTCLRSDGYTVADGQCTGAKPDARRPAAAGTTDYSGCTFSWQTGSWSPVPAGTCGYFQRERTVSCVRSDGAPATASRCSAYSPPSATGYGYSLAGCTYAWRQSGYRLGACTNNRQTYTATYSCRRADGEWVQASYCEGRQPSDVRTQSCTYWRDHANDPYADARPGDAAPSGSYSTGGGSTGTSQSASTGTMPAASAPGAHSGGSYDASTGEYTLPGGQVLAGGYYDNLTNTYWDTPEAFRRWQAIQQTGVNADDVIVIRRVIVDR